MRYTGGDQESRSGTEWQSNNVRVTAVDRLDDVSGGALNTVPAGLVERFPRSQVCVELQIGECPHPHRRRSNRYPRGATWRDDCQPVCTWCSRPRSSCSMRLASAMPSGLLRIWPSISTVVSAPSTTDSGYCLAIRLALRTARAVTIFWGVAPDSISSDSSDGAITTCAPNGRSVPVAAVRRMRAPDEDAARSLTRSRPWNTSGLY